MNEKLTAMKYLKKITKPSRYTGGELNEVIKDRDAVDARFAFCFPDTYEIGMSNLGIKILYDCLNKQDNIWCERCFAPWPDMGQLLREKNIPLYALESGDALKEFDFVGFTLQYELSYSNVLYMLDLAGIPLYSKDRDDSCPIIIGGGPCSYNPEPVADFFDIFSIGEGEFSLVETVKLYIEYKKTHEKFDRNEFLRLLSPYAKEAHAFITGGAEELEVSAGYRYEGDEKMIEGQILSDLKESVEKNIILGYTTVGPHRDDLKIKINGEDVKTYGSQGQQRTAALSLKLAELEVFNFRFREYPVLLLDDALSELDLSRRRRVLERTEGIQTIITCTDVDQSFEGKSFSHISVSEGKIIKTH